MKFPHFFIDRPIFATVVSIITILIGIVSFYVLPVAQYPDIVPPTIVVRASYPGANAETISATVATPLEQEINGVEDMLYMSSQSTSDGNMSLTITFKLGTDLNVAQVLVQNRVAIATAKLPEEVRRLGVTTRKSSPDLMMVVHLLSPDNTYDQLYISNYAILKIKDVLARLDGVGDITIFGAREYSLRAWFDPDKLATYSLTANEVVDSLREQNVQVSGGTLGNPPTDGSNAFQYVVSTQGRFENVEQFENIIVKSTTDGKIARLKDVARVELGAKEYGTNSYMDNKPAVAIAIFQRPGTNALQAAKDIQTAMDELKKDFPKGIDYTVVYNPTEFISESVTAVIHTLLEATALVVLVVLIFLQSWRTAIIPIAAIPVSLIGTFAVMSAFGFSINTLTLFGLVLAIGIVVDDAIVVVENIERHIANGETPKEAAHKTMDEVGTALVAIALVLSAVFIPTAFIPGISGQFYKQFALTIATATILSAFNSLTLSPALGALLLKPHDKEAVHQRNLFHRVTDKFAEKFNYYFDNMSEGYAKVVRGVVRRSSLVLVVYAGLIALTLFMAKHVPTGFIPSLDQGYAITVIQLPDGAALGRTDQVVKKASQIIMETPGIIHAIAFAGFSGATFTNASNQAAIFTRFDSYRERAKHNLQAPNLIASLQQRLSVIDDAFIMVVPPPSVRGLGNSGGFRMQIQDTSGNGFRSLLSSTNLLVDEARKDKELTGIYTTFTANTPQVFLDIDRAKARMLNVPISNIFQTLQVYLGSSYVNDFNIFGRAYQVTAQADMPFRLQPEHITRLKTRSANGALVPLGNLIKIRDITSADLVQRYNMYISIPINGNAAPGYSSGQALDEMEKLARENLPQGTGFAWTELAYQQKIASGNAVIFFVLSVVFVFLLLAAQYESWSLPLAIILIVPMCVLCALTGINLRGMDNNILTQIGLVVLVGLSAKNAILIVEFARQQEVQGKGIIDAVVEACRLRIRPILMTSFAFIFGVLPLTLAVGAGAEMRQALGTAVFSGMLGVTFFGLFLTPVFYVMVRYAVCKCTKKTKP
ncbi:multidrug efflux RND transporter permease subunit [Candidatus Berkiella aquae]|uniref:Efflux pump membrane transporter n=1 Tax=Candidatus Berkiella aquae TaxID=295108 RepID=A0A0Q9YYK2_9GAMM|nr:multidrug efflux RND transporter permease subunit [Candidatus Berkiella aquae]MCS5710478.1 efflux RND transporter permease subunit [Candidatus Berkiella aquae]